MQELIKINGTVIKQPDEGLGYGFETTYSADSTRVQSGAGHFTPIYTVESFTYTATNLTKDEMKTVLQFVAKGGRFTLHYFSPYFGEWRDAEFFVKRGTLTIGRLNESEERFEKISFSMQGVETVD